MVQTNPCGTCTLCCKLLEIPALAKPQGRWCPDCAIGKGCRIYDSRPAPCRDFACLWLASQAAPAPLPPELRPDRSKAMFYTLDNGRDVIGISDPAATDAWKAGPVQRLLQSLSKAGMRVMFGNGRDYFAMDRGRARPVELTPPDDKGVRTFARFLD